MRKKWLVIGGIGIVLLLLVALAVRQRQPKGTVCEQLIQSAIANKPGDSYGLLAEDLRSNVSEENWASSIEGWYSAYATSETNFKLVSRDTTSEPDNETQKVREEYAIKTATGSYRGICYLDENGDVEGYRSEVAVNT